MESEWIGGWNSSHKNRDSLLRTCSLASSFYGNEKNSIVFVVWIIVVTYQINMADDMFFQASLKIFRQKPFQFLSKHFPISNRSRVNTFWKNVATFEGDRIHPLNLNYHGLKKKKKDAALQPLLVSGTKSSVRAYNKVSSESGGGRPDRSIVSRF